MNLAEISEKSRVSAQALARALKDGDTKGANKAWAVAPKGVLVKVEFEDGERLLTLAARAGNAEMCKALIASGASVDARSGDGSTALMVAAKDAKAEAARELMIAGADVGLRNAVGKCTLDLARDAGCERALGLPSKVTEFIEMEPRSFRHLRSLLSSSWNNPEPSWLKEWPANACYDGTSVLAMVASEGRTDVMKMYLEAGADPTQGVGIKRLNPGASAAISGKREMIRLLFKHGLDPRSELSGEQTSGSKKVTLWAQMLNLSHSSMSGAADKYMPMAGAAVQVAHFSELVGLYAGSMNAKGVIDETTLGALRRIDARGGLRVLPARGGVAALISEQWRSGVLNSMTKTLVLSKVEQMVKASGLTDYYNRLMDDELALGALAEQMADRLIKVLPGERAVELPLDYMRAVVVEPNAAGEAGSLSLDNLSYLEAEPFMGGGRNLNGLTSTLLMMATHQAQAESAKKQRLMTGGTNLLADRERSALTELSKWAQGDLMPKLADSRIARQVVQALAHPVRGLPDVYGVLPAVAEAEVATLRHVSRLNCATILSDIAIEVLISVRKVVAGTSKELSVSVGDYEELSRLRSAESKLSHEVTTRGMEIVSRRAKKFLAISGTGKALALAWRVFGTECSSADRAWTAQGQEAAERVEIESGALGLAALKLGRGLGLAQPELSLVGQVKSVLRARGLSEAGWRMLASESVLHKLGNFLNGPAFKTKKEGQDSWGQRLGLLCQTLTSCAQCGLPPEVAGQILDLCGAESSQRGVNWIPRAGESCPVEQRAAAEFGAGLVSLFDERPRSVEINSREVAHAWLAEADAKVKRMPSLVRALLARVKEAPNVAREELALLVDCLDAIELGAWGQLSEKPTWNSMMRLQQDWHDIVNRKNASPLTWSSDVVSLKGPGGWEARALTSGLALHMEGKAMHHCVSSYAGKCFEGAARVFEIRVLGERVGTLELRRAGAAGVHVEEGPGEKKIAPVDGPGNWVVSQFRGPCNAAVVHDGAENFVGSVAQAYQKNYDARLLKAVGEQLDAGPGAKLSAHRAAREVEAVAVGIRPGVPEPR